MLTQAILLGSITSTLVAPLMAAAIISATFLLPCKNDNFELFTYRTVRVFYVFLLLSSVTSLISFLFKGKDHGSILFTQIRISNEFAIALLIDFNLQTIIFLSTCALITAIITFFSHRYLHRDPGYRRFFIVISLFVFGMHLIILASTFDLIFAGWEIVGISSFLLIGYFWHRPKAIAAACRAYYIYRLTDLGLLISILLTHLFWHDADVLKDFLYSDISSVMQDIPLPSRWLLSMSILIPVLGKSAQFPFCFWLPKAMEGPTHSSAIFYGSLSIHVGVFLLIKTMPIWYLTDGFRYVLGAIGLLTALASTLFALVQSNIKGQIGYASIAQVGLMLVELALGFTTLAFVHMIGNAFLRCFQLLVSSSILSVHLQSQNMVRSLGQLRAFSLPNWLPSGLHSALYIFAINDGYLEETLKKIFITPVMSIANFCNKITQPMDILNDKDICDKEKYTFRSISPLIAILFIMAVTDALLRNYSYIRLGSLLMGLVLALAALGERRSSFRSFVLIIFANIFAYLSMVTDHQGFLYLMGLLTSSIMVVEVMYHIISRRSIPDLYNYHGLYQEFPLAGTILLMGLLGVTSFPFSSTFFGEDILLFKSLNLGWHYLLIMHSVFIISGWSTIRSYSLMMFGKRENYNKGISLDISKAGAVLRMATFAIGNIIAFWPAISH